MVNFFLLKIDSFEIRIVSHSGSYEGRNLFALA